MRLGLLLVVLLNSAPAWSEPVIWRCEDLQKLKEFSSIQCAPDAEIYVPSRTNAGSITGGSNFNRRYLEFLNRHSLQNQSPPPVDTPAAQPAPSGENREGRNLQPFKSYIVPR